MNNKTLEMDAIHNLLKEVKQSVINYKNLKLASIEVIISTEKDNSYGMENQGFYIRYKSVNPENGEKYMAGDIIKELDRGWLIKKINSVQRNTVAPRRELMHQS
jgi:hypothetical protein